MSVEYIHSILLLTLHYCAIRSYSNKDKFQIYRRWRQISGEIYILIITANCVIGERSCAMRRDEERGGRLASTRRDRSLIFRRKVLALSKSWWCHPKEEDNIWCCLHQQPTPPRPFAQPPLSTKWRKLVFNYSCTHPPSHPLFVSRSFLHGFPRCHHPVHPSSHPLLSSESP